MEIDEDRLSATYRELARIYDERRYADPARLFHFGQDLRLVRRAILNFAPCRDLLVDVACGTGQFTIGVTDLFSRVVGIDLTSEMLARAAAKTATLDHVQLVLGSAMALPIRPGHADVVLTTRFLHLFPRDQHRALLEGLLPVLRPGGILIVEHDGPIFDRLRWLWRTAKRKPPAPWHSYHVAEAPPGVRRLARWGVSAPTLPAVAARAPRLAHALARGLVHAPMNQFAKFTVVVYRKL